MRADTNVADGDTPLAAPMRETAAATVDTIFAELRRRPIVYPECVSLQDAAAYTGYSDQQFSDFVKRGVAPKSVLFSRNARRFQRSDVDAWCTAPECLFLQGRPGRGAAMNKQLHPNLFVFDRTRIADGFLFAAHGDRARYLGKSSREKPDWLKQNEGRYRSIEDVLREGAPGTPPVEAEINPAAGPAEPADLSSSPEVRNDGNDKDDVASADPLLGDRSRPRELTSPATPVKESAEKQKPPAGIARSTPKLCPELMLPVLDALAERPFIITQLTRRAFTPRRLRTG